MLDEFQFAIKHFVPTLPQEVKGQAQQVLDELTGNAAADEAAIKQAFYDIGVQEYPHRRAYEELTRTSARERMNAMVIEHVDETVRGVIKPHLDAGVSLDELVGSEIFESQLDAKQRYQVEDGILVASDKLAEALKAEVGDQADRYNALVAKWTQEAGKIQDAINELEMLAQGGDENQQAEIKSKVARLREGFLITERDPELEEVKKEIEYWKDTFASE